MLQGPRGGGGQPADTAGGLGQNASIPPTHTPSKFIYLKKKERLRPKLQSLPAM